MDLVSKLIFLKSHNSDIMPLDKQADFHGLQWGPIVTHNLYGSSVYPLGNKKYYLTQHVQEEAFIMPCETSFVKMASLGI